MNKKRLIVILAVAGGAAAMLMQSCVSIPKGAKAVKPFDPNKYLGKWYEIARFDYRFERNLNNVTAEYSILNNGNIRVENRGFNYKTNEWKSSIGKAKPVNDPKEARLKVSFFGPFYSGYNVIALDDDYKYALVAGDNLNYLWLLSREKSMPEEIRQKYITIAEEIGYDTSKLIWVMHNR